MSTHSYSLDDSVAFHIAIPACNGHIIETRTFREVLAGPDGTLLYTSEEFSELQPGQLEVLLDLHSSAILESVATVTWDRALTGKLAAGTTVGMEAVDAG